MSLRLAWAGPWNAHSAIAAFGRDIVGALAGLGHAVEVFRTETGEAAGLPALPAPGAVHPAGEVTADLAWGQFDALFVNLGDHYGYHGAALPLLAAAPAVAILHDASMDGFRHGWQEAGGTVLAAAALAAAPSGSDTVVARIAALASGAVVHARHYRDAVAVSCPGPVMTIPLAMAFSELCGGLPLPPEDGRLTVATIGHVNGNKQADQVIRAIAASPLLRHRVHYLLIGPVEPAQRERLLALAQRVGAPAPEFMGRVSDEVLRILLAGINVICCLRHPVLEGGSASLILALRSDRPTLVSDQGSYADIPDGLVLKCAPGEEAAHVLVHLESILDDPEGARAMAERARDYAETTFAPLAYAESLLRLAEEAALAAPAINARGRIRATLLELGLPAEPPALAQASRGMAELLTGPTADAFEVRKHG